MRHCRSFFLGGATALALAISNVSCAQEPGARDYDIAAQDLKYALRDLARQAGLELIAQSEALAGKKGPALHGRYSAPEALSVLLNGTGLTAEINDGAIFIRGRSAPPAATAVAETGRSDIVVTGSRIRGISASSTVIGVSQVEMRTAGQADLGQVIRSLPQNFSGGQNPGVDVGASAGGLASQNLNGGSAINLRGLGPDASLTLINGHRVAYGSFTQAIDISAIPLAAVDRIEIVTDGASAIYGSDAVAGVANIILKRDFSGIEGRVRLGKATEGGDFQQQYSLTGGMTWESGGVLVAYDFERDGGIRPYQRRYTSYMTEPNVLIPPQKHHSAILSAHHELGENVTFKVDGSYSHRETSKGFTSTVLTETTVKNDIFTVAPQLDFQPGGDFLLSLSGVYGRDRSEYATSTALIGGPVVFSTDGCYCNSLKSVEFDASGSLFKLPGGSAKVAAGGGYRDTHFSSSATGSPSSTFSGSQESVYAFGELFLPLITPDVGIIGVRAFSIRGAVRYEDYHRLQSVFTPKVGASYSPVDGIELTGSWGRSFKAPTLTQQYQPIFVYLYPAQRLGATGGTLSDTALYTTGGNPNLKPERATNWSTTLSLRPKQVRALSLALSYFNIRYRNRVIQPIANATAAFSDPVYADFLSFDPSLTDQNTFIAPSALGLINSTGGAYQPANVIATVNNLFVNVASQKIQGIDLLASYALEFSSGKLSLNANASWITSKQRNNDRSPSFALAGTIYDPPHLSGRVSATWASEALTLAGFVNYIGGVRDTRSAPAVSGSSMVTMDTTVSYRFGNSGALSNLEVGLAVNNLTSARPPYLKNLAPYYSNYDSTNYSAIGRFVSLWFAKRW